MQGEEIFTLQGKTALVTGAAQGLGKEIALGLAKSGASLVLSDIRYPEESAQLVQKTGGRWIVVQTDITDEAQVEGLVKKAASEYGKVDILVNNAGVSQLSYTPSEDLPLKEWDNIIRVNLTGTYLCCKHI